MTHLFSAYFFVIIFLEMVHFDQTKIKMLTILGSSWWIFFLVYFWVPPKVTSSKTFGYNNGPKIKMPKKSITVLEMDDDLKNNQL